MGMLITLQLINKLSGHEVLRDYMSDLRLSLQWKFSLVFCMLQ